MVDPPATIHGITLDVNDIERAATFWSAVLGIAAGARYAQFMWLGEIAPGIPLILQRVDEAHRSKNRMHFELTADDPEVLIATVIGLGGNRLDDIEDPQYALTVMSDPDGNEFCVTRQPSPSLATAAGPKG